MDFIHTLILGIVEGLTEFLPVSSTGHLILAGHLLGVTGDVESTFEIFIQLGAILAVVFLYSHRFKMLFHTDTTHAFSGFEGCKLLAITSLPAMIIGFLLHDIIKHRLFNPITVSWALIIGGILIILVERLKFKDTTTSLDQISPKQALMIGLFQCLALWPGASRSASTIIGGLFAGLNRKLAAEYSFIAAVPIMIVATLYDLLKSIHSLHAGDMIFFAFGFVVSFIAALFAIKFFIRLVQHTSLSPFGVYRIAIGLLSLWVFRGF